MARVVALLAHAPGLPEGDVAHGMELRLRLAPQGQIDIPAYERDPQPWRCRRYWPHRQDWWGELIRVDDGDGWALRAEGDPDEPLWSLSLSRLRPGEHLSLRRPSGEELVFRIVQVEQD